jgi:3-demethoxyubiquinol 3-hydroxylase
MTTPRDYLERVIRVDHAGEYGARRIYQGQLAVLRGTKYQPIIEHMQAQEEVHLKHFTGLIGTRRVRPTALLPLWHIAGFALGAASAALGHRAAMEHYAAQEAALGEDEAPLKASIAKFRAEELEHRDTGLEHEAELTPGYRALSAVIKAGCKIAIKVSERV